jgi:hypothetical protein
MQQFVRFLLLLLLCYLYHCQTQYVLTYSWDVPLIFWPALTQLEFSRHIFKDVSQYNISRKRRAVDAELFHAEGQTDMTKLIVAFRKVAKSDYWLRYVRPSIRPQGSTRLAMDRFSRNLILSTLWKYVEKIQVSFKYDKYNVYFYMKTNIHLWQYVNE